MSLYPVSIHARILINHYDGQPYLFWSSFGGGWALANQEDCRRQIGQAARTLVAEELEDNMNTYLEATVDVYPDEFEIVDESVELSEEYDYNNRPRILEGENPNLKMDYGNIRANY